MQPKRATGLADRELAHLEMIFNGFHQRLDAFTYLPANYWSARVKRIEDEYALVVTQQKRLTTPMKDLESLNAELRTSEQPSGTGAALAE